MSVNLTLGELAGRLGAVVHGDSATVVDRVDTLSRAGPGAISFLSNRRYRPDLSATGASAVLLAAPDVKICPCAALVLDNPYVGYALVATWLNPQPVAASGIHPSASVDATAQLGEDACVAANVVVGAGVRIGARVYIGAGSVIEDDASVGEASRLSANVTLCKGVSVGARCLFHPGVVIGADGFGIANDGERWIKVPQLGSVCIGDDVEIGANSSIDRGALEDTIVGNGVKIDNQVQVGHNTTIGEHTAIAGCVGIAGSAHIGRRCTIGGAAAIGGHLHICDDVHLTACSTLPNSIEEPGVYSSGMPVQENRLWRRNAARMRQLDDMMKRLRAMEAVVGKARE